MKKVIATLLVIVSMIGSVGFMGEGAAVGVGTGATLCPVPTPCPSSGC